MKSIALGQSVGCGQTEADSVVCWGELDYRQWRGGGEVCNSAKQETVRGRTRNAAAVALSPEAQAATVWLLGSDGHLSVREELPQPDGVNTHADIERRFRRELVRVPAPGPAVAIGVGGMFEEWSFPRVEGCVLRFDGRVGCVLGPMGRGDIDMNGKRWPRSFAHACALLGSGRLACFGDDRFGQAPPSLAFDEPATSLAIGGEHGCALLRDETVSCWGAADWSLGKPRKGSCPTPCADGRFASCDSHPRPVPNLMRVKLLRAASDGSLATCAVTADHSLVCWGERGRRDCDRRPRPDWAW